MIALKAIYQTSFTATNTTFITHKAKLSNKKSSSLCLCSPTEPDSEPSPAPDGDTRKQELLARIAQLQAQKVRLTDFLDERSTYLTKFGEEASVEFDKIGEEALQELDEAGNRIMDNIRSRMQEFEEAQEKNRLEIEANDNELEELQDQMIKDRNEGLFFQNLRPRTPIDKAVAKEETGKIDAVSKKIAGSKIRKNIYLGLITLLAITISNSIFLSSSTDWRRIAVLGVIMAGLITQVVYEQSLLSESKETENSKTKKDNK